MTKHKQRLATGTDEEAALNECYRQYRNKTVQFRISRLQYLSSYELQSGDAKLGVFNHHHCVITADYEFIVTPNLTDGELWWGQVGERGRIN